MSVRLTILLRRGSDGQRGRVDMSGSLVTIVAPKISFKFWVKLWHIMGRVNWKRSFKGGTNYKRRGLRYSRDWRGRRRLCWCLGEKVGCSVSPTSLGTALLFVAEVNKITKASWGSPLPCGMPQGRWN